jgi:hypothetical protein
LAGDMSLIGHVMGHPRHADGKLIRTATVVWLESPGEMGRGEGHHLAARRSFSAAMRGR